MQESFDRHSARYGERVVNRKKYRNLSLEDELLAGWLQQEFGSRTIGDLIDAACGTGDRLKYFLEHSPIQTEQFTSIVGLDYAPGMLKHAAQQQVAGRPLYTDLSLVDLSAPLTSDAPRADLVLCQWEVVNTCGPAAGQLLSNLRSLTTDDGWIVFDVLTTRALPFLKKLEQELTANNVALPVHLDPQTVWYERDDHSLGQQRLFSPQEVHELVQEAGLQPMYVWGYTHRELVAHDISIDNGSIDVKQAQQVNTLLFIAKAS